jgi:hypothetical protein
MGTAIRYTTAALIEMMKGKTARARITITDADDNVITYDEVPFIIIIIIFIIFFLGACAGGHNTGSTHT